MYVTVGTVTKGYDTNVHYLSVYKPLIEAERDMSSKLCQRAALRSVPVTWNRFGGWGKFDIIQ